MYCHWPARSPPIHISSVVSLCYGISVLIWIMALSRVPVGIAYPMLSIGYVVNALAAWYLFGEALTSGRWLGIGFVIIGVYLLADPEWHRFPPTHSSPISHPQGKRGVRIPISPLPGRRWTRTPSPAWSKCCVPAGSPPVRRSKIRGGAVGLSGWAAGARVNSATAALEVALQLCGIGPGDEVITVANLLRRAQYDRQDRRDSGLCGCRVDQP